VFQKDVLHPFSEWLNWVQVDASASSETSEFSATARCKNTKELIQIDDNDVINTTAN